MFWQPVELGDPNVRESTNPDTCGRPIFYANGCWDDSDPIDGTIIEE